MGNECMPCTTMQRERVERLNLSAVAKAEMTVVGKRGGETGKKKTRKKRLRRPPSIQRPALHPHHTRHVYTF